MARETQASALERYRSSLDHARRWRESEGLDAKWRDMMDMYRGVHFPKDFDGDAIAVNLIFSTVNVIFPSVTINHPKITVSATKPGDDENKAVIAEAVLNYWWRHYDFRKPFRRAAKDSIICGAGWLKIGYKYKEEDRPLPPAERQRLIDEQREMLDGEAEMDAVGAADMPTDEQLASTTPSTEVVVVEDRPFMDRVSPLDMFVDPEATCLEDADWIAQRIFRTLADVRKDKRYRKAVRAAVEPDASVRDDRSSQTRDRDKRDTSVDRVTVWEYYDLKRNSLCVFPEGSDDYLVNPQPIPFSFGHPFVFIPNYEVPDEFYPMGDVEQLIGLQMELNKTRTQMMQHRDQYGAKWVYREDALTDQARDALASNEPGVAVPITGDMPLDQLIQPMPINPLNPDMYRYSDIISEDLNTVSGVNEYARGATPEIRRTATEAAIIQDAANARAADKLAVVEGAISECARRLLMLAQMYLTGEQVARVSGNDAQDWFFSFDADDIKGEFDFQVEGGSTQPNNETIRRQTATAMMQALGPFIGQVIDPGAIAQHVLREGFGVKNPEKFMMAPPPPTMDPNAPMGAAPPGAPPSPVAMPPEAGAEADGTAPPEPDMQALIEGIPPEILMQIAAQFGLNPTSTAGV